MNPACGQDRSRLFSRIDMTLVHTDIRSRGNVHWHRPKILWNASCVLDGTGQGARRRREQRSGIVSATKLPLIHHFGTSISTRLPNENGEIRLISSNEIATSERGKRKSFFRLVSASEKGRACVEISRLYITSRLKTLISPTHCINMSGSGSGAPRRSYAVPVRYIFFSIFLVFVLIFYTRLRNQHQR